MTKIIDRETIDFLLFDVLNVGEFCGRGRFADHDRQTLGAVLDLVERIAEDHLWPHAAPSDAHEPRLEDGSVQVLPETIAALGVMRDAGLFSAHCDYEEGGMQLPLTVNHACNGLLKGANTSTASFMTLTKAAANLLNVHGTEKQKRLYMRPMLEGRFFGTMCLSEPEAGSSLVDIRTKAEPLDDGRYAISGNKMWISAGDHNASENIVHLVLARTPGSPAGVKGISLFAVPKYRVNDDGSLGAHNGISVAGLNHKMGYRGISNCLLNFGEANNTEGTLVGAEHRGLVAMFHMMNEARIGVGTGAAMLGSVGYRIALEYARERRQGRSVSNKDPSSPPVAIASHPDVKRMLMRQKAYTEGAVALCLYAGTISDRLSLASGDERDRLSERLDVLTPVVKAWPSEFGLEANKLAIQVLGGYGYTRDFPVERIYRDNRLNMIHEGTNGIQALDLLGRKAVMNESRAINALLDEIQLDIDAATSSTALSESVAPLTRLLVQVREVVKRTTAMLADNNTEAALTWATPFLHGFGHVLVSWLWLKMGLAAEARLSDHGDESSAFLEGKIAACRYFFDVELPEAAAWIEIAKTTPDVLSKTDPAWL